MTRDPWLYFPSEGSHTQDFYALKKSIDPGRDRPMNLGSRGKYDNHWTTRVDTSESEQSTVHSAMHRGQPRKRQKDDFNKGISQTVGKLAEDGKEIS